MDAAVGATISHGTQDEGPDSAVADRLAIVLSWKHEPTNAGHNVQQRKCRTTEWYSEFTCRICAGQLYSCCPGLLLEVDVIPLRFPKLAAARRCQNAKLQSAFGDPLPMSSRPHECAHLRVRQLSVVTNGAHLLLRREQLIQMPPPAGGVHLALPIAARPCPVENRLDPPANS